MTKRTILRVAIVFSLVAALAGGCKRDQAASGSGALDSTDRALFQYLPAGSTVLFGGNYMKLQNFMQSAMGQLSKLMDKVGPGMSTWMACFADLKSIRIAGALKLTGMDAELRFVLGGTTIDEIQRCAQKASFKTSIDADHKFLSVDLPGSPGAGYLVLPSGALYSRQGFAFSLNPKAALASRAELEGDIAALGKDTAADDSAFKPLIENVDRSKTIWLVGSAAGTMAATKIGNVWGTMDLADGIAIDLTAQLKVEDDAKKAEDSFAGLRKNTDQLPSEDLKAVVKTMTLTRHGGELHVMVKASDAQIKSIIGQLGGMMGAGLMGGAR